MTREQTPAQKVKAAVRAIFPEAFSKVISSEGTFRWVVMNGQEQISKPFKKPEDAWQDVYDDVNKNCLP